jgi:hypothetical protein
MPSAPSDVHAISAVSGLERATMAEKHRPEVPTLHSVIPMPYLANPLMKPFCCLERFSVSQPLACDSTGTVKLVGAQIQDKIVQLVLLGVEPPLILI